MVDGFNQSMMSHRTFFNEINCTFKIEKNLLEQVKGHSTRVG